MDLTYPHGPGCSLVFHILASQKGDRDRRTYEPSLQWPQPEVLNIALFSHVPDLVTCPQSSLADRSSSYSHLFFAITNNAILTFLYIGPMYFHCYFYRIVPPKWNCCKSAFLCYELKHLNFFVVGFICQLVKISTFFKISFYRSIVDLQCSVSFKCTAK